MKNQDYAFETIHELSAVTGGNKTGGAPSAAAIKLHESGVKPLRGAALEKYNADMAQAWRRTMWEQMGRSAY
jgi:hypothetical protein